MTTTEDPAATKTQKSESFAKRTTFYVNHEWEAGRTPDLGTRIRGQMYVESLEPSKKTQKRPIILIHGDYHSSQIWLTKPDGAPGWASYFLGEGYHVYLVELPMTGKSNNLTREELKHVEIRSITPAQVEKGAGIRGKFPFDMYYASLKPLYSSPEERQTLAQNALKSLLKMIGKAILIGEGTGATAAWLAADVIPDLVLGVVAVEPPGPPFCEATVERQGKRMFDSFTKYSPTRLKYGLSTIPLTFDPAVRPETLSEEEPTGWHPLDLALFLQVDTKKLMVLQYSPDAIPAGFVLLETLTNRGDGTAHVRKLTNLSKMRHVIFTGEASSHSQYDVTTMCFMKQAGLTVDCGFLERYGTCGNGHLMFLETNSDEIAAHIVRWIQNRACQMDKAVVASEPEGTTMPPPTIVPSSRTIEEGQCPTNFPKRARRAASRASELPLATASHSHFIDLTDEPQHPTNHCANGTIHTTSDEEYMLSSASSMVFPGVGEMMPPLLPTPPINFPNAPPQRPETSMGTNAKGRGYDSALRKFGSFTSPENPDPGSAPGSVPIPKRALVNPQQVVVKQHNATFLSNHNKNGAADTQKPMGSQITHATLDALLEYRNEAYTSAPLPISTAMEANPPQAVLRQNEFGGSGSQESKQAQISHDNHFTGYRFHFSVPQTAPGQEGNQDTALSAPYMNTSSIQAPWQQAAPLPPSAMPNDLNWQANPYMWPMHSGPSPSSSTFAQAPRSMPDFPAGESLNHAVEQFWEPTGDGSESTLDGMPTDFNFESPPQNDGDFGTLRFAF